MIAELRARLGQELAQLSATAVLGWVFQAASQGSVFAAAVGAQARWAVGPSGSSFGVSGGEKATCAWVGDRTRPKSLLRERPGRVRTGG